MTSFLQHEPSRAIGAPLQITEALSWRQRHGQKVLIFAARLGVLAAAIIGWQLMAGHLISLLFVSKPTLVWHQLVVWADAGTLWSNSWITIKEILLGYVLGAAAGVLVGFGLSSLRALSSVLDPFIMALYAVPKVALAPLFIVWFGIGLQMKVILAATTVFFLVFINTAAGIKQVDTGLIDAVRLMGGSRAQLIRKVILPASMSGVLTGLRVAIPYALIGAVIGELVASNKGLGYLINDSASTLNTAGVFAALVTLTVIAAILNALVNILGRWTDRWRPADDEH
ncbi:ABC transporter permease [Acidiferrimicrobium sp. IK]|uniref:ABC transporter permease n=1 Tax=Acidiferrimicrobium sp. IK TaxID=2871700 RepID=UPI0021CB13AF|nr:ABC transporter permease [Acidiferrimicrobium sp. IK]MCU4184219.1 ABC transporter permease [Acidiferrimicrobium sp. IK]